LKLFLTESPHFLQPFSKKGSIENSITIFDDSSIKWNINIINSMCKIDTVYLPEKFSETFSLVKETFPSIEVKTISENFKHFPESHLIFDNSQFPKMEQLTINLNSMVYQPKDTHNTIIDTIKYPWDYLSCTKNALDNHITKTSISPTAKIAKTSIIYGPCIIEDNVTIDDFCKIQGPIYIGKDSFIGMGSLVRNCVLGKNTTIGFNCEIAKSYFAGSTEIAHHNVILDSVIGENVWFGGYSGTANVLLTKKNVKYQINDELIDTGINHFGAVVGNGSSVGAAVIILPGRQILPNSVIQAGTIFGKKQLQSLVVQ